MMGKTHLTIGFAYGVLLLPRVVTGEVAPIDYGLILSGLALGSLMPDLDHPQSMITARVPLAGWIVSRLVSHRGILHSILGLGLWSIAVGLVTSGVITTGTLLGLSVQASFVNLGAGFLTGYFLHILADIVTTGGVRLFYPAQLKVSLRLMSTGGLAEYAFRVLLILLCSLYAISILV